MTDPVAAPHVVRLADGTEALVRPIEASDEPHLREGFEQLSRRSKELRFLSADLHPQDSDFRYLLHPDGVDHFALVMERHPIDPAHREGIAVARCVREKDDPTLAEFAIVVADAYQRRGAGLALLRAMRAASRERGIERWVGLVRIDNPSILETVSRVATLIEKKVSEPGVYETLWSLGDDEP